MSNLGKYTRRTFFSFAGGAAVMAIGLFTTQAVCPPPSQKKKIVEQLLNILPHEEAKYLGRRLLPKQTGWTDRVRLASELLGDLLSNSGGGQEDSTDLATLVEQRCREDFAGRRVVDMDGWVLSHTEAKLCTLHALSDAPA